MKEGRLSRYGAISLRVLVPVAITAIVWYVTLPVLRYTLLMQEQKGLFLFTPDYFRQVFSDSWPVTTLISDFLVQFYRNASLGALVTALIVAKTYMMACTIFRFSSVRQVIGGLAAAATWYVIAHANTPHTGVVILMFSFIAAIISLCIPYKKIRILGEGRSGSWQAALAVALVVGAACQVATDRKLRDDEKWYAVEYCSRVHDWDVLLAIATPELCRSDMSYVPYSLLALNAKGQLGERLFDYPVTGPESLGDIGDMSWSAYSLRSQISELTGGTNEAIHQTYQMGMATPHGTSFGALRQLIRLEIENGNYDLAVKHAMVLRRSPFNVKTAEAAIRMADSKKAEVDAGDVDESVRRSADAMVSENNAAYNLSAIITYSPNATAAAKERLLCHLLLSNDRDGFNALVKESFGETPAEKLPRAFRNYINK